jgi:hypothetical protein
MLEIKTVTNGPIAKCVQRIRNSTLPWLICISKPTPSQKCSHEQSPGRRISEGIAPANDANLIFGVEFDREM